jgi:hypothetical protein
MPLIAPEVKGPISTCSKKVRIKGHIAGATVKVLVNGAQTASKVSNWPDDVFDINASLNAGDKITATQEFGGEASPESPLPAVVQHVPSTLANLTIPTHLHQCGTAVWTEGSVPGSKVEALIGSTVVGEGESIDGIARLKYYPGLGAGQSLALKQTTCNNNTKTTTSAPADPIPNPLPIPKIEEPLIECMTAIKISNITDGATVTIYRDGIKDGSGAFDLSSLTWIGLSPLKEGELIEVDQSFTCGRRRGPDGGEPKSTYISGKANAKVQSAANLKKPIILKPVCPDATLITITNLLPSARVVLYKDGIEIGKTDTPESTFSFAAPPLGPNAKLTARMQLCGKDGPLSEEVEVSEGNPLNYLNVSKLYECAAYIFIRNDLYLKGKIVYAKNKQGDIISAYHQANADRYLFPVSPALVAGDEITIVAIGCGGDQQEFGPFKVEPLPERLPAPVIDAPVTQGSTGVEVISEFAGAILKVYVDGVYRGQAVSRGEHSYTPVGLTLPPLQLGQQVTATQSLCEKISEPSKPETVVIPPPQVPQLIQPANNASGVPAKPTVFKWSDPGANTSAAATTFYMSLYKGNSLILNYAGQNPQTDEDLSYNTKYTWKVDSANSTGNTTSPTFSFKTEPEPEPEPEPEEPPQQGAVLKFGSSLYGSYDGITQVWPVPANTAFYLCIIVANIGNATSDPYTIEFAWQGEGQNGTETVNAPAAAPNWSGVAYKPFPNGLPEGQYTFEVALVVNNTTVDYTYWNAWIGF